MTRSDSLFPGVSSSSPNLPASACRWSSFAPPPGPSDGPVSRPDRPRPWRSSLLQYSRRHFYAVLQRWSSLHAPLLLSWDSFCRVFLPPDEAGCATREGRDAQLGNSERRREAPPNLHACSPYWASPEQPKSGAEGSLKRRDGEEGCGLGPRRLHDPVAASGAPPRGDSSEQAAPAGGWGGEEEERYATWPSLQQMNRALDDSAGGGGPGNEGFRESDENLRDLAQDVWEAFQIGGGLEAFQLLGGLAWLLPACLRTKCRALTRVFDIMGTGKLTCAELSILLDRSLEGLARLLACPALSGVATPYSRALLNQALRERTRSQREGHRGESGAEDREESKESTGRDGRRKEKNAKLAVHVASNDPVPWDFLMGVLQEVERKICQSLQPALEMADVLRMTFPSGELPWTTQLQPGALFLGHYEVLQLLHKSSRVPHGRVVLKVQEKATGHVFALKAVVNRQGSEPRRHSRSASARCSPLPDFPALRLPSFLAEAAHLQKRPQQLRAAGRAHTARCTLQGEVPPFAFQLLAWEEGETLEAFLNRRRADWCPHSTSPPSSPASSSSPVPRREDTATLPGSPPSASPCTQLRAPAFSETELVALWLSLLSVLEEHHRVGITHGHLLPRKILLQSTAGALGPFLSSGETATRESESEEARPVAGFGKTEQTGDPSRLSFTDTALVLLDWQLGIDAQLQEKATRSRHSCAAWRASSAGAGGGGCLWPTHAGSPVSEGKLGVSARASSGTSEPLEDEISALVGELRRGLAGALAGGVSPEDIEEEISSFAGRDANAEGYAPPELQLLHLYLASQAACVGQGSTDLWPGRDAACESAREREASAFETMPGSAPRTPSLSVRKTWDLYATARIIAECVTLQQAPPLRRKSSFWSQFGAREPGADEGEEEAEEGNWSAGKPGQDSPLDAPLLDSAGGPSLPSPPVASDSFLAATALPKTRQAILDLRGVKFDPFRIRYLAKFARHLNAETLMLPSASSSLSSSPPLPTSSPSKRLADSRSDGGEAEGTSRQDVADRGFVSVPLARMLSREEKHLHLSGKNLTSLEAVLIARTLLTASWIEELRLNDNAFGSAPPGGIPRQPFSLESPSLDASQLSPSFEGRGSGQDGGDQSWRSSAAAQLLGVSLTCMHNLQVLDLNRCQLCTHGRRVSCRRLDSSETDREEAGDPEERGRGEGVCRLAAAALKHSWPQMKEIDFSYAEISDGGLDLLADAVAVHGKLQLVNLSGNRITVVGLRSICRALCSNHSVGLLSLQNIPALEPRETATCPFPPASPSSAAPSSRASLITPQAPLLEQSLLRNGGRSPASPVSGGRGENTLAGAPLRGTQTRTATAGAGSRGDRETVGLQEPAESACLLQMIERAVSFNVQYKELRKHTSAFEIPVGAPLMCETLASWLDGDSYLQRKLLSRLQHVRRLRQEFSARKSCLRSRLHSRRESSSSRSAMETSEDPPVQETPGDRAGSPATWPADLEQPATASWAPNGGWGGRTGEGEEARRRVTQPSNRNSGPEGGGNSYEKEPEGEEGERRGRLSAREVGRKADEGRELRPRDKHTTRLEGEDEEREGSVSSGSRVRFSSRDQTERSLGARTGARWGPSRKEAKEQATDDEDQIYLELENAVADKMLTPDGATLQPRLFPAFKHTDLKELEGLLTITPGWHVAHGQKAEGNEELKNLTPSEVGPGSPGQQEEMREGA
ncbi:putative leucine rich repeat protein [Neospora caninum Liverpool]|uniref:Putative leucine rich repeat protein n=1 Tax=Neospora caninum (strain Liverpool) TaxID=572307 RepID=F0VF92_NEOCL|nr:putative leucine rich repeat protein [Neospora caninum Liverpool]CBZ52386.1 putative leucine rich repeat protein [Neospora caninum Liverpool]|eukprot:XP_003882418.1 putative leucine rich repeat protein [Neospora caninum Liverpool]